MDYLAIWYRTVTPKNKVKWFETTLNMAFTTIAHRNALNSAFINGKDSQIQGIYIWSVCPISRRYMKAHEIYS